MATETTPAAATASPLRVLLANELEAIAARVRAAATKEEKRLANSQYAQRIEHLAARIKEIDEAVE